MDVAVHGSIGAAATQSKWHCLDASAYVLGKGGTDWLV